MPVSARNRRSGFQRHLRRGDDAGGRAREPRIAGFHRLSPSALQHLARLQGAVRSRIGARCAVRPRRWWGRPPSGPDAMSIRRSPGTSEMSSVMTCAGWQAAASRPPLIAERWRRTQLTSLIVAPELSNMRFTACFSSSVRPGAGSGNSAEPPPDIRHSTRSSAPSSATASSIRSAARIPAASGTGCADSAISICRQATAYP